MSEKKSRMERAAIKAATGAGPGESDDARERALIDDEWGKALGRTCNVEPNILLTREATIEACLSPATGSVTAGAPDVLPAFRAKFGEAMGEVKSAMARRPFAIHGGRRYSPKAKTVRAAAAKVFTSVRRRAGERLTDAADGEARARLCVNNASVSVRNPISLHAGLVSQQEALSDPALVPRLESAGVNPSACLTRVGVAIAQLESAIAAGTFGEAKKGQVDADVMQALVKVDVVLSRARVFLEDYVSEAAAEALDAAIPHRHAGTATTPTPTPQPAPVPQPAPMPQPAPVSSTPASPSASAAA